MDSWFKFDVEKLERELKEKEKKQEFQEYLYSNPGNKDGLGER